MIGTHNSKYQIQNEADFEFKKKSYNREQPKYVHQENHLLTPAPVPRTFHGTDNNLTIFENNKNLSTTEGTRKTEGIISLSLDEGQMQSYQHYSILVIRVHFLHNHALKFDFFL